MDSPLFARFAPAIRSYEGNPQSRDLLLASEGPLECFYAPFDWVNPSARLVVVGITPGRVQADNALREAKAQLLQGRGNDEALRAAKRTGAFSGAMRPNLVTMLDHIGVAGWLGLGSCSDLFGAAADQLQSTSVLPFPIFLNGQNYNGTPDPMRSDLLRSLVLQYFVPLLRALPNAAYVPLGPVPSAVMGWLVHEGHIEQRKVLAGLPHPSGANAERIAYFVGAKPRHALSAKTDPIKLDAARVRLTEGIAALRSL